MKKKNEITEKPELLEDALKIQSEVRKANEELKDLKNLEENLSYKLNIIETSLRKSVSHDPNLTRPDSVECVKLHFEQIMKDFSQIKTLNGVSKEGVYHLFFNISLIFYEFCHKLRNGNFSLQGVKFLLWSLNKLESNIVLSSVRYVYWRFQIYAEIAYLYEAAGGTKAAFKVVQHAVTKLNELKSIEEQQTPLPEYINRVFVDNLRKLKILDLKFGIQSGLYTLDVWKKKIDEFSPSDRLSRNICLINSLQSNLTNEIQHQGLNSLNKPSAVTFIYDLLKEDLKTLKTKILNYVETKKKESERKEKIKSERDYTQHLSSGLLNPDFKYFSESIPLALHSSLLLAAFDCKLYPIFLDLSESLKVRINYRSLEVPFLSEIDLIVSSIPYSNIPNKFEKNEQDLNINNLKKEIKIMREKGIFNPPSSTKNPTSEKNPKNTNTKDPKKKAEEKTENNFYENFNFNNFYYQGLDHTYIHLILKRSHNPKNAIINFRVEISNDKRIKSLLMPNERAIALPIKTYDEDENKLNVDENIKDKINKENSKLIPYIIYQKTENGLATDIEKLNAITDIVPMISNSPWTEPIMNYTKNPIELTMKSLNLNSYDYSHDYINFAYKTDQDYHIVTREFDVINAVYQVEISYSVEKASKSDTFLNLFFSIQNLEKLTSILKISIEGEIGEFFLIKKRNLIYDACDMLWKKYLKNLLAKIDYFKICELESDEEIINIENRIKEVSAPLCQSLHNIHSVLSRIQDKDPLMFGFLTTKLADLSLECGKYEVHEKLKITLDYLNDFREKENLFSINNSTNKHSFTTFTCDNNKIFKLFKDSQSKLLELEQNFNLKRRKNLRKESNISKLKPEEEKEENFEIVQLESEYETKLNSQGKKLQHRKDLTDDGIIENFVTETENTLNCLYVDIAVQWTNLYLLQEADLLANPHRELNNLINLSGTSNFSNSNSTKKSLRHISPSSSTMKKLDIIKGQSAVKTKENIDYLKNSLQSAGKMEPDRPNIYFYEKKMSQDLNKNSYMDSIFQFSMAKVRQNRQDQKYFLTRSLEFITNAFKEEETRYNYFLKYFPYILAFSTHNKNKQIKFSETNSNESLDFPLYPYNLLYRDLMIPLVQKIPEPILLHHTSKTATLIFPLVKIPTNDVQALPTLTKNVALYGQISTGSNIVQMNNCKLSNTGEKHMTSVLNSLTVHNLEPNQKYIFAYAGYDNKGKLINSIGETSKEVEMYFPSPLFYITYHFCKLAYNLKHYEICKKAAKNVFEYYTEQVKCADFYYDNRANPLIMYKFKRDYLNRTCLMELEAVAHCLFLLAKCNFILNDYNLTGQHLVKTQKNIFKNLNILTLSLELACEIRDYALIEYVSRQIYNSVSDMLKGRIYNHYLLCLLVKVNLCLNLIPDSSRQLRNFSSQVSHAVMNLSMSRNEVLVFKKILNLTNSYKRFYKIDFTYLKRIDEAKSNQKGSILKEPISTEGFYIKDLEREQCELDEYILSFGEFNEFILGRVNNYYANLDKFATKFSINNPEFSLAIEKRKKELNEIVDIWEGFKNEGGKFLQKFITNKDNERYYEFCAKILKRTIENLLNQVDKNKEKDPKLKDSGSININEAIKISEEIFIKESDSNLVNSIYSQKMNFLSNDIIFLMKMRIKEFLNNFDNVKEVKTQTLKQLDSQTNEDIRIKLEEKYFGASIDNEKYVPYENMKIDEVYILKEKYFWIGDIILSRANLLMGQHFENFKSQANFDYNNFLNNYHLVDLTKLDILQGNQLENSDMNINNKSHYQIFKDLAANKTEDENRHKSRIKIFEKFSMASLYMKESNAYSNFDNLIYSAYNLLLFDMLSPVETKKDNLWIYLSIISSVALERLKQIKKSGTNYMNYSQCDYTSALKELQKRIQSSGNTQLASISKNQKINENFQVSFQIEDEKVIPLYESSINFDIYIQFLLFAVQSCYLSSRWNVVCNMIQNFNEITLGFFSSFTLPLLIEGQKKIYEKAEENSNAKQKELEDRVQQYEAWKNSRKKNKRQQMITGEIPQEQIVFEHDYAVLSKEYNILASIAGMLKKDMEKSEQDLFTLNNDKNNSMQAVQLSKIAFEKIQLEVRSGKLSKMSNMSNMPNISNISNMSHLSSNSSSSSALGTYKKAIQILKKRQENYLLIQMLYETAVVYFTCGDYGNAETYFNEALDTVFQKLYSLRDFRSFFLTQDPSSIITKYGIHSLLWAVIILHKLNKYIYDCNLYLQRESAIFSAEIISRVLSSSLPNPQSTFSYALYRLDGYSIHRNLNFFKSSENVSPASLLVALIENCEILIGYKDYELTLPMLCLAEAVSCDIVKNLNYLHKTRILKIVSLANLGMINEAIQIYAKIFKKIDLPSFINSSLYVNNKVGLYSSVNITYFNSLPPDNPKNFDCINSFSKFYIDNELSLQLGITLSCELNHAKNLILFKIYEKENYQIYLEKSDTRQDSLLKIEKETREGLIQLATAEELINLVNMVNLQGNLQNFPQNSTNQDIKLLISKRVDEIQMNRKITKDEIANLYLTNFGKNQSDLRRERIDLIARMRIFLARIYTVQGLHFSATSVILKGIENLKKYSEGFCVNIETSEDYIIIPSPQVTGNNKKAPEVKKQPEKKVNVQQNLTEEEMKELYLQVKTNRSNNSYYWLAMQRVHLENLFKMGRYEDSLQILVSLIKHSQSLNDVYFYVRFKEIEIMIHSLRYNTLLAENAIKEISEKSKQNFISDLDWGLFIANYAEFLFANKSQEGSKEMIKEARKIIWTHLSKVYYPFEITKRENSVELDKNLKNILKEKETFNNQNIQNNQNNSSASNKKKSNLNENESNLILNSLNQVISNPQEFSTERSVIDLQEQGLWNNIYFLYIDIVTRIDLRYAYITMMSKSEDPAISFSQRNKAISSVLNDLLELSERRLYAHNSNKVIILYLLAKISKSSFLEDLQLFAKEKLAFLKDNILIKPDNLFKFTHFYNEKSLTVWTPLLTQAKEYLDKAIALIKNEFYVLDFGFEIKDLLLLSADVNMMLSQFRYTPILKFCDINAVVNKFDNLVINSNYYTNSKEDQLVLVEDDLSKESLVNRNNFLEDRSKSEKKIIKNLVKSCLHYTEQSIKISTVKNLINENVHELANANLIDPSKIPKDIINAVLENDSLNKKKNKQFYTAITNKANPDTFDLFYYFRNLIKENSFFALDEGGLKNVSKLHKYLKMNCSNYNSKCYLDILPCLDDGECCKKDSVTLYWLGTSDEVMNIFSDGTCSLLVNLVYVIGPSATNESEFRCGRINFDKNNLIGINKRLSVLKINFKQSSNLSENKKKRDYKYLSKQLDQIIADFSSNFSKSKRMTNSEIIKEPFGEISSEIIEMWSAICDFNITSQFSIIHPKLNAFLLDLHLKLHS